MAGSSGKDWTWAPGGAALFVAAGALTALFAGFFVLALVRRLGLPAMAFGGFGALWAMSWTLWSWRKARRLSRGSDGDVEARARRSGRGGGRPWRRC
jgi:hypothetical protein